LQRRIEEHINVIDSLRVCCRGLEEQADMGKEKLSEAFLNLDQKSVRINDLENRMEYITEDASSKEENARRELQAVSEMLNQKHEEVENANLDAKEHQKVKEDNLVGNMKCHSQPFLSACKMQNNDSIFARR
jgi:hypothetical protein